MMLLMVTAEDLTDTAATEIMAITMDTTAIMGIIDLSKGRDKAKHLRISAGCITQTQQLSLVREVLFVHIEGQIACSTQWSDYFAVATS